MGLFDPEAIRNGKLNWQSLRDLFVKSAPGATPGAAPSLDVSAYTGSTASPGAIATEAPKPGPGAVPKPGYIARTIPTFAGAVGPAARFGVRALPVVGTALAAGNEAINVADVANDPGKTGYDVAQAGAMGVSRLAAAGAGAGLGFASPIPGGAAIGGALGYFAPDAVMSLIDRFRGGAVPKAAVAPVAPPRGDVAQSAIEDARQAAVNAPYTQPTASQYTAAQQEQSQQADKVLRELDARVGRGGYDPGPVDRPRPEMPFGERVTGSGNASIYSQELPVERINTRIRNIMADPKAIGQFNEAQRLNRTGIMLTRGAKGVKGQVEGQAYFSNDPGAQTRVYQGADGQPTQDWTKTENYQSAIVRNAADKAQLADIEAKREQEAGLGAVQKATTVAGKKLATELYLGGLQNQTARANIAAHMAAAGATNEVARSKLGIDLMTAVANNDEKAISTAMKRLQVAVGGMEAARPGASGGDIIAAMLGRAQGSPYHEVQNIVNKPGEVTTLNQRTNAVTTQATRTAVRMKVGADGKVYKVVDGKDVLATPAEEAQFRSTR